MGSVDADTISAEDADRKERSPGRSILRLSGWQAALFGLAAAFVASFALATGIDLLIHVVGGKTSVDTMSNPYWIVFFACAAFIASGIFILRSTITDHPEYAYLLIVLCVSCLLGFTQSFWEAGWDEGIHFRNASLVLNEGDTYGQTRAEAFVFSTTDPASGANVNQLTDMSLRALQEREGILNAAYDGELQDVRDAVVLTLSSMVYVPSALMILFAKGLGLPFSWIYLLGKLPCILIYSFITFLGMKKLRGGKALYAAIALIPTTVFLAADYSYAYWTASLLLMGFAYLASILQTKDKASWGDITIMLAALSLACLPRFVYFPLIFSCLVIPSDRFATKRTAWVYRVVIVGGSALIASMFFMPILLNGLQIGDARGGDCISPPDQAAFIIAHPLESFQMLWDFLFGPYAIENGDSDTENAYLISGFLTVQAIPGYLVNYGYLPRAPSAFGYVVAVVLLFVALTDKDADGQNDVIPAATTIILCGVAGFMVIVYMYLSFNDVGADVIRGVQRRYFLPLVYPALVFVGFKKWNLCGTRIPKGVYNITVMGVMVVVLMSSYWMSYLFQLN